MQYTVSNSSIAHTSYDQTPSKMFPDDRYFQENQQRVIKNSAYERKSDLNNYADIDIGLQLINEKLFGQKKPVTKMSDPGPHHDFSYKPVINSNYPIPESGMNVTDRLLSAGQYYDEKKRYQRIENELNKRDEEERSILQPKDISFNHNTQSVEDRLTMYKDKYENKKMEKQREIILEEAKAIKNPQINPTSEKIASNLPRGGKVEDRLLEAGQKQKIKHDELLSKEIAESKQKAIPKILNTKTNKIQRESGDIAQRLYELRKTQEAKKEELKEKYSDNFTYTPKINETSKLLTNSTSGKELVTQKSKDSLLNKEAADSYKNNCTFQPQLSKKSLKMAEKLEPAQQRLLKVNKEEAIKKAESEMEKPSFTPNINPVSSELDNRLKYSRDGKTAERWEALYELNAKKKNDMDQLKKNYEESKKKEEEDWTFKPTLLAGEPKKDEKAECSVVQRALMWDENRKKKIEEAREKNSKVGLNECTFKPALVGSKSSQVLNETKNSTLENPTSAKSIEKFIERQIVARQTKEQKEEMEKRQAGSGHVWKNQITIPKAPKFMENSETSTIKSLSKPITPSSGSSAQNKIKRHNFYPVSNSTMNAQKNDDVKSQNYQSLVVQTKKGTKLRDDLEFDDAVRLLHQELHSLEI